MCVRKLSQPDRVLVFLPVVYIDRFKTGYAVAPETGKLRQRFGDAYMIWLFENEAAKLLDASRLTTGRAGTAFADLRIRRSP